jgi:hypothetical protein
MIAAGRPLIVAGSTITCGGPLRKSVDRLRGWTQLVMVLAQQ